MNAFGKKIGLAALLGGAVVGFASAASAQSTAFDACAALASAACVQQIGNNNGTTLDQRDGSQGRAVTAVVGNRNTVSAIQTGSEQSAVIGVNGNRNTITTLQAGKSNVITVAIDGNRNGVGVNQNGNGNRAGVTISGNDNGRAAGSANGTMTFAPQSLKNYKGIYVLPVVNPRAANAGQNDPKLTPLTTLEAGQITQSGDANGSSVFVVGSDNRFHVSQYGDGNSAVQAMAGSANQAAVVQGTPATTPIEAFGNSAVQFQAGAGNTAYIQQTGNNNAAVQVQAGPFAAAAVGTVGALAALAGTPNVGQTVEAIIARLPSGTADGNNVALVQNKNNNIALLNQYGSNNNIGLVQPGNAYASVTQIGSGHSIGINQQQGFFGTASVTVTQF